MNYNVYSREARAVWIVHTYIVLSRKIWTRVKFGPPVHFWLQYLGPLCKKSVLHPSCACLPNRKQLHVAPQGRGISGRK